LKKTETLMAPPVSLTGRLSLETPAGLIAGANRIRLLEAIDTHGSITRAAKAVPMSYKAAWDAVDAMNNVSDRALVERSTGGRQGGGTRLTPAGMRLVAMYRALEREQQGALDRLQSVLDETGAAAGPDARQVQAQLRRLSLRTSARNQFVGRVVRLSSGRLGAEVVIELDTQTQIAASVTRESAKMLCLALGSPVLALVKASSVLLGVGDGVVTSARNQLYGTVSRVLRGPLGAEVTLTLPAGRSVTASITRSSLDRLGLARGKAACALFKASSVILVGLG
jgi:molybdate transport system regulatory protein